MNEEQYERYVVKLEHAWEERINGMMRRAAIGRTGDEVEQEMRDEVKLNLLHHADWDKVDATDISDIVGEAYERWEAEQ